MCVCVCVYIKKEAFKVSLSARTYRGRTENSEQLHNCRQSHGSYAFMVTKRNNNIDTVQLIFIRSKDTTSHFHAPK